MSRLSLFIVVLCVALYGCGHAGSALQELPPTSKVYFNCLLAGPGEFEVTGPVRDAILRLREQIRKGNSRIERPINGWRPGLQDGYFRVNNDVFEWKRELLFYYNQKQDKRVFVHDNFIKNLSTKATELFLQEKFDRSQNEDWKVLFESYQNGEIK